MPGTYSQILLHVVHSTKQRRPYITADIQARLYEYVGGIIRAEKGTLYAIGGMPDHVYMLLRWRTDGAISDLMRAVKARSSRWVHETFPIHARLRGKRDMRYSRSASRPKPMSKRISRTRLNITRSATSRKSCWRCCVHMASNMIRASYLIERLPCDRPPPLRGGGYKRQLLPRVARSGEPDRCTRGYNPPPLRGERRRTLDSSAEQRRASGC